MRAKVAIVGGGVVGTSIALSLARRLDPIADPVVLVERAPALGTGASRRAGGILSQHAGSLEVSRLARDSLAVYAELETRTGRSVGFRRTGVLTLAGREGTHEAERLAADVASLREIGIDTDLVDAAGIRRLVPGIRVDEGTVGAWEPAGGVVDAEATIESFAALARSHGAVTRLGAGASELAIEAGRIRAVATEEGTVEAEIVVVAAGSATARLLARAGLELPLSTLRAEEVLFGMPGGGPAEDAVPPAPPTAQGRLPVEPAAAVPATSPPGSLGVPEEPVLRQEREALERVRYEPEPAHPVVIDREHGFRVRCEPRLGCSRVVRFEPSPAGAPEDPDAWEGDEVAAEHRDRAREWLVGHFPAYGGQNERGARVARDSLTPDARPLLGAVPGVSGLFVATGFSGYGFELAPAVGEGLTQLVLGEPVTGFDPERFDPGRFG